MITVSTHSVCGHKCCPHRSICYNVRRDQNKEFSLDYDVQRDIITGMDDDSVELFYSCCSEVQEEIVIELLSIHKKNLYATMNFETFRRKKNQLKGMEGRLQLSVWTREQVEAYPNIQKLFLVKDEETYPMALSFIENNVPNIHFPIVRDRFTRNELLFLLAKANEKQTEYNITVDSCLEHAVLHGNCCYEKNYVDLHTDNTFRRCPFQEDGLPIKEMRLEDLIKHPQTYRCQFLKEFGGKE